VSHLPRRYLIPLVLLALGAVVVVSIRHGRSEAPRRVFGLADLPFTLAGFQGRELPSDESVFAYLGADEMIDRLYVDPEQTQDVKLSIVFARGWRALHSPRACYKNQGWAVIEDTAYDIPTGGGEGSEIHGARLVMEKSDLRIVAIYTFATGEATTGSWFLHSARMAFGGTGRGGALIAAVATSPGATGDSSASLAAEGIVREATQFMRERWERAGKAGMDSES